MIATWLTVVTIGFLVVVSPGPNYAVTVKNSLVSRKAGMCTVAGMAAGSLIHISYCLLGIGVIISKSVLLFNTVKWLGALYLIFLGIKSLVSNHPKPFIPSPEPTRVSSNRRAFFDGLLTCLFNPKATLFYLALFTQIVKPGTPVFAQIGYGLTMVAMELAWYSLIAAFLNQSAIRRFFSAFGRRVEKATGLVLIGMGIRLALSDQK